jgi:hypothetical protein
MRRPSLLRASFAVLLASALFAFTAASADAAGMPWWHLSTQSAPPGPTAPEGKGQILVEASNLGTAPANRLGEPVTLTDHLPPGVEAVHVVGQGDGGGTYSSINQQRKSSCSLEARTAACEFPLPVLPYEHIVLVIDVKLTRRAADGPNEVTVSGGLGLPLVSHRPLAIAGPPPSYGLQSAELSPEEEGGAPATRAGSHPFQLTTTLMLNARAMAGLRNTEPITVLDEAQPIALARDVNFNLPPGLIGNPDAVPKCPIGVFSAHTSHTSDVECPPDTILGVADFTIDRVLVNEYSPDVFARPIYNLETAPAEPARFGFEVAASPVPVILDASLRNNGDYGVTVSSHNISEEAAFLGTQLTFWGDPADPSHDSQRGVRCLGTEATWESYVETGHELSCPLPNSGPPFLSLPTACAGPLSLFVETDSWLHPGVFGPFEPEPLPGLDACNRVPFSPTMGAEPTSDAATSPTGLGVHFDVTDEGLQNPTGIVQSQLKKTIVTLPEGFTTNPSVAAGLGACSQAAYESTQLDEEPGSGCPNDSKIGDIEVESPLVEQKLEGSLYVAEQRRNPFGTLLALYMVARNPELGVLIKAAGKVEANPLTGQLTTTFDDLPQLPFSHFHLSFRQGQRSPLITPPACGTYATKAVLFPWANPEAPLSEESPFQITAGPEGEGCPSGGTPPFHPGLVAGSLGNAAGHYTPFYIRLTRRDSEQEITHFSIKLPPGVIGKLAGIPLCTDAQIAQAKSREREEGGGEEERDPSCPAASEVGRTLVETGVGTVLAQAPGKVYLAGPYHGSAISVVAITNAKVGPFDLGTVVVRSALRVNPETGEVFVDATGSDPIPHIVDGIPTHLRDIRIYMDRPEFVLNPTSCERTSTASTVLGSGRDFASEADDNPITVTSPFQAADCAALPFKPRLSLRLIGKTNRGAHPRLRAHLSMHGIGEAGIAFAQVALPHSEFIENAHFNTICTKVEFAKGAVPGEKCPAGSVYGRAKATTPILSEPLQGPVFLRSNPERELPDVVAALHSGEINVDLVGHVDSVNNGQIRTTFESVPDAPVTSFDVELLGGSKGLFVNSTDLCAGTHRVIADFTAHNGKVRDFHPALKAQCPKPRQHKHRRHRAKR